MRIRYKVTLKNGQEFIVTSKDGETISPGRSMETTTRTNILGFGGYPAVAEFPADEVVAVIRMDDKEVA